MQDMGTSTSEELGTTPHFLALPRILCGSIEDACSILHSEKSSMTAQHSEPSDPRVELARDRTQMASFRTQLALDRTTLAWIRTSLGMASFGFGMVAFFRSLRQATPDAEMIRLHQGAIRMGTALIILGIVALVLAGTSHWFALKRLCRGEIPVLSQWSLSITVAALFAIIGLAGIWFVLR
jgi:putative membrane protein